MALNDAELQAVMATWPALPEPVRRAVMALVGTVTSVTVTKTPIFGGANWGFGDGPLCSRPLTPQPEPQPTGRHGGFGARRCERIKTAGDQ